MIKLSRRNWNNVLIFVVLLLMFVLYGIPQRLNEPDIPAEQRLIPADTQLLMVSFGQQRLIQAGSQWQLQPPVPVRRNAEQLALAWQHTLLTPVEAPVTQSKVPVAQASVQVVGHTEPLIWLLYPDAGDYLLQKAGEPQFYQLSAAQAAQLFLLELPESQ